MACARGEEVGEGEAAGPDVGHGGSEEGTDFGPGADAGAAVLGTEFGAGDN
jgi:hypothetical protein